MPIETQFTRANGLRMAYETFGQASAPPVVLIQGLQTQMLGWPEPFCRALAEHGYCVVRFDNRDIGLSEKLPQLGRPNLLLMLVKGWLRLRRSAAYTLDDMAQDTLGLIEALGFSSAHIVGASMGGMIAQLMAARYHDRVRSLTSIMSSSGDPKLPGPTRKVRRALWSSPDDNTHEAAIQQSLTLWRLISSPRYPPDPAALEAFVRESAARGEPSSYGGERQLAALIAAGSRVDVLQTIRRPSLVIHGENDPLVPLAAGVDTARLIPEARLEVIPGMAHDLPRQLTDRLSNLIAGHLRQADAQRKASAEEGASR
ncbi:MAG: alpha/beta hydrolase [Candidatus Tectomicrobia bacterium]